MATNATTVVGKNCLEVGVLTQDANGAPNTTQAELDQWITNAMAPNTWLLNSMGDQPDLESFFGTAQDTWIIIDLSTMKVVQQTSANGAQAINDLIAKCS